MKPAAAPLAEARGLSVDFVGPEGTVHAVKDASWVVHDGETLAIVGESGSGKSVSVEAFTGTLQMPPARIVGGQLLFRGEDLLQLPEARRRAMAGKDIAMIFQDTLGGLNPVLPIGWQVAETARIHGVGRAEANERALELLTKVGIPDAKKRFRDHPHELSGGQRQRVMIAIALALNPSLVIADEPTSALDATVQAQILALLKSLQEERGSGMVLVTHDMGVVSEFADRVVVMKAGEIVESGTTAAVLNRPSHPYVKSLLEAVPGRLPAHTTKANPGPVLMEVDEVRKTYASLKAVDGVSFSLRQGETIGIVGESGSGKSTLVRLLLALEPPSSGSVSFRGEDINRMNRASSQQLRRHVQAVFQDPSASLNPLMTVRQIISEPWEIHPGLVPRSSFDTRVAELLLQVGLLPEHARRHPHQFSGGQQQRIAIARALAMQPDVIICDEAVSALDVTVQAQIMQLLTRLRDERGISYIFIAHNLAIVRDFATRALVMYKGGVVEEGSIDAVFERPQHPYTKRLLASSFMMGAAPQGLQDAVLS